MNHLKKQKLELTWIGKPWRYVLIPHNAIAVNMTLDGLAGQYGE